QLPKYPYPTNQRAEITAIIIALEQALQKYDSLETSPYMDMTAMSDSKYAIQCMANWIYKWSQNGWVNAARYQVANQDLIKRASDLDNELKRRGTVTYE
ncbi:ribonuclease H-like domain-containing protein, partial [Dendryphion nanum]